MIICFIGHRTIDNHEQVYEEWMKTPEGKRTDLSPEERALFDAQQNAGKEGDK